MRTPGLGRQVVRAGLIGATAIIYCAMVGLIEQLDPRKIVGSQLSIAGVLFLGLPPIIAAYVATRPRQVRGEEVQPGIGEAALAGALVGLIVAAITMAAIGLANLLGIDTTRNIFKSVSPTLLGILYLHRSAVSGLAILSVVIVLLGAFGGVLRACSVGVRRPIVIGLSSVVGFGMLQRIIPTAMDQLGLPKAWLYSTTYLGLTWFGAVLTFAVAAGLTVLFMRKGSQMQRGIVWMTGGERQARTAEVIVLVVILLLLPFVAGTILSQILGSVGIYVLMGLGLNIVVGYAGLLDLGYVAFFAVGAYITGVLTGGLLITTLGLKAPAFHGGLSFFIALPIVILAAALVGVLIGAPVLRLRGDYLAIVTLGFGEIARALFTSDWLKDIFGGTQGLTKIPAAPIGSLDFRNPRTFYYLVLVFCILAAYIAWRLQESRVGRAWNAMREDEQVAEAVGVSSTRYKLLAFALGGAIGAVGGALFAVQIGSLNDASFTILVSITTLAIVILGGMGSIPGVVVGALVLIGVPGLLSEFQAYQLLVYGAVLMAVMILRPQGLIPNVRRTRELHEEERAQDKWAGDLVGDEDVVAEPSPLGEGSG
ncbi:MAG TPA: branched-chain amino acid ABC transporter permease [Actinomycetota bacterium]|nr:branched-chain amino acid ABC transporter permease [Actinomycetota bacterium]